MNLAIEGYDKIYKIYLADNTIAAQIVEEDKMYIKIRNSRGFQTLISKDLILKVACIRSKINRANIVDESGD